MSKLSKKEVNRINAVELKKENELKRRKRAELISIGKYMGRPCVFADKRNRKRERAIVREICY